MSDTVLVLNSGSSSIKFQLFEICARGRLERHMKGVIDGIGVRPRLKVSGLKSERLADKTWSAAEVGTVPAALEQLVVFLRERMGGSLPKAVGHRVVHGGPTYTAPTVVTDAVLDRLEGLVPLAPLHQPNNLAPIRTILDRLPDLTQVACFDTAFHRGHAEVADCFA